MTPAREAWLAKERKKIEHIQITITTVALANRVTLCPLQGREGRYHIVTPGGKTACGKRFHTETLTIELSEWKHYRYKICSTCHLSRIWGRIDKRKP